jgi:hypothetical protein
MGRDVINSSADEGYVGLGIGIGIAVVGEVSEMANRLDKGPCGSERSFLVGELAWDFRRKEGGWVHPWRGLDLCGLRLEDSLEPVSAGGDGGTRLRSEARSGGRRDM